MADQRLRLLAELKDNMSSGLKAINKELKDTQRTPGMDKVEGWFTSFTEKGEKFVKQSAGISGAIGSMGVGGLAAAAGLGALFEQFKELGDHTFAMKRLGQETKMTVDQVARWEYVGQVFHMPVEQVDAALKHYGDSMVDFMRRRGEIFGQLNTFDHDEADKLIGIKDPNARFQEIIRWLGTIKDVATRERWAAEFFGSADIASVLTDGMPGFNKAVADAAQNVHTLTAAQQKQYDDLNASMLKFDQSWNDLKLSVGTTVFTELKQAADDFKAAFDEIKPIIEWVKGEHGKGVGEVAGDVAGLAKDAVVDKSKEIAKRWEDRAAALNAGRHAIQSEDGNILRKQDEMPLPKKPASKGWFGGLFGGSVEKSAFTTFDDMGGGSSGSAGQDALADGVKAGVLGALREWAQEGKTAAAGGGLVQASYEGGGIGGGRRSGGAGGGSGSLADGPVAPFGKTGSFDKKAPEIMRRLMSDFGIDKDAAAKVLGNLGHESAGFSAFHEGGQAPNKGGIGWAQWTGSRRREFEAWSAANHLDPHSDEANYGFLKHELSGKYASAISALKHGGSLEDFEKIFEGARIKAYGSRHAYEHRALHALAASTLPSLADESHKVGGGANASNGGIDAHIRVTHEGVKGVTARSTGNVKAPAITVRRGPTMTQPDYQA